MTGPAFTIEPLHVPTSLDAPDAADFRDATAVRNVVDELGYGSTDFVYTAEEALPRWQPNPHAPMEGFIARLDGRVVARAAWETRQGEGATTAWLDVRVHPEARGRGIGTALADHLETLAVERGATKAIVYVVSPPAPGPTLESPTGFGTVPRGNPEVRFLLGRGYRLEQVERASRIPLPFDADTVERLYRDTVATAGDDYRVVLWRERTPDRWLEDMAMLLTRMSTEAPSAGLEEPEDVWTVERLVDEETRTASGGRLSLTAAVEHVPTGRLAGFTELVTPTDLSRPVSQEDTLVLRAHRGHRLGMLLKLANLRHLAEVRPGHPAVTTFNAEENRHMLDVNEAVGFVPVASEGAWRKDFAADGGSSAA